MAQTDLSQTAEKIWAREFEIDPAKRRLLGKLRSHLTELGNPHALVLTGRPGPAADEASARALEAAILNEMACGNIDRSEAAEWLRVIHRIARRLTDLGYSIEPTRLPVSAPAPVSPFSPAQMLRTCKVPRWRAALNASVLALGASPAAEDLIAALILSSVLNGALLDTTKIKLLVAMIERRQAIAGDTPRPFVEFDLPLDRRGIFHLQRWFPDALSALLLVRANDHPPRPGLKPANLVRNLLRSQGVSASECPRGLKDLVETARSWWSARAAPTDIGVISRRLISHSIHRRSWHRVLGTSERPLRGKTGKTRDRSARHDPTPSTGDELIQTAGSIHLWWQWLDGLFQAGQSHTQILSAIAARNHRVGPGLASTLLGFAIDLLKGHSASKRALSLRTVREHVTVTTPRLLAQFEPRDPATLDTTELESNYTEILDLCANDAGLQKLQAGLREFHDYLVRRHGRAPIVRPKEVLGDGGELLPVDANLVSFDEYEQAQRRLDESRLDGADEDDVVVCKLALAFAFRLGMRRMEIFGLRIDDIHIHRGIHCLVLDYPEHRLKTNNSRRTLPAHAFLSPQERVLLKNWHARRVGEERRDRKSRPNALLLARPALGQERVSADGVTRRVCAALREVTGDRDVFMHHLRHSFATWNYLALRMGSLEGVADFFDNLPLTQRWFHQHRRRSALLLGTAQRPTSRIHGYAIARLLGHSSPAISLTHYIHSADLALAAVVDRELDVGRRTLVAASGLARSTAYPLATRAPHALVEYVVKNQVSGASVGRKAAARAPARPATRATPEEDTSSRWLSLRKVHLTLRNVAKGQNPVELGLKLGLRAETIESICEDAHRWAAFVSPHVSDVTPRLTVARTHDEHTFATSLESRLRNLYARSPELCVDGLTLHLHHYNRQKNDVVFKGAKEAAQLKRYLRFLRELQFADCELQTVLRQTGEPTRPGWIGRLRLPTRLRVIAPPTATKASTYAQWVGIVMTRPSANACGALAAAQCFLALVAIANIPKTEAGCVASGGITPDTNPPVPGSGGEPR